MALTLFGRKDSINVQKVMWLLRELGADYTLVEKGGEFGGLDDDEFKDINVFGRVPVLQDGDFKLAESNAILRYLVQSQPGGDAFYPADLETRARIDSWMDFGSTTLYPEFMKTFSQVVRTQPRDRKPGLIAMSARRFQMETIKLGNAVEGKDWLFGENFTLADIATGVYMYRFYSMPVIKRVAQGRVERWVTRLQERPAYDEIVATRYAHMFAKGS